VRSELLLIQLKLFLESWHLVYHVLLRISQFFDDLSVFTLLLLHGKFEILTLGFQNLGKLRLFRSHLFDLSLKVDDLLLEFLLLRSYFTQDGSIELIVSIVFSLFPMALGCTGASSA
jgi:hypothetical protein